MYVCYTNSFSVRFFVLLNSYVCRLSKIFAMWIFYDHNNQTPNILYHMKYWWKIDTTLRLVVTAHPFFPLLFCFFAKTSYVRFVPAGDPPFISRFRRRRHKARRGPKLDGNDVHRQQETAVAVAADDKLEGRWPQTRDYSNERQQWETAEIAYAPPPPLPLPTAIMLYKPNNAIFDSPYYLSATILDYIPRKSYHQHIEMKSANWQFCHNFGVFVDIGRSCAKLPMKKCVWIFLFCFYLL